MDTTTKPIIKPTTKTKTVVDVTTPTKTVEIKDVGPIKGDSGTTTNNGDDDTSKNVKEVTIVESGN